VAALALGVGPARAAGPAADPRRRVWRHPAGGRVVLEPFAHRVSRVGRWRFDAAGPGSGQLNRPLGAAVAPDGRVFVANTGNDEVLVLGADGALLESFGGLGGPRDLAFAPDGRLAVVETRRRRVSLLDADGRATAVLDEGLYGPVAVAFDAEGRALVADMGAQRVVRFDDAGRPDGAIALAARPRGLACVDGRVYVAVGDEVRRLDDGAAWHAGGPALALSFDGSLRVMTT
jgi:DNA-binding beta-propeller fold protein YncE